MTSSLQAALGIAAAALIAACAHSEPPPLNNPVIGVSDKFFDADALDDTKFVLLGYQSKILRSEDGGATWKKVAQPMKRSMTRLQFVDAQKGFGVGHGGKIATTNDGGTTWTEQSSGTEVSLFDLSFPTPQRGYAVGDGSTLVITGDGGSSWRAGKIEMSLIGVRDDMSLAIEDPIFYSIHCLDEQTCWVTGEFGQIRMTQDGGQTWDAQHQSLLKGMYRDIMALPTILTLRMRDRMNGIGVGTYGYVFTTTDGGANWNMIQSPVKTPLYDIKFLDNGDTVMVGSSGVILIGNEKDGWKRADVPQGVYSWISSISISPSGKGVAAGGHGLVLTTGDHGKTWDWKIG